MTPEVTDRVVDGAYFHISNGGLSLSIVESTSDEGKKSYRLEHKMSNFGMDTSGSFPLQSEEIVSWLSQALQRAQLEIIDANNTGSFGWTPFNSAPDVFREEKIAARVVSRFKEARGAVEPSVVRSAKAMYEELVEAEAKLHKAVQFSRGLSTEPTFEWLVDQLEENHKAMAEFTKNVKDSLEYVLRQDI